MNRFLFIFILLLALPAQAEDDKAAAIRAQLAAKKAEHAKLEKKAKQINTEVKGLQLKLVDTGANIRKTETALLTIEQKLKKLRYQEVEYVETLYKEQTMLGGVMTAARRMGTSPTSQLLVQSTPIEVARASLVMKSLIPVLHTESRQIQEHLEEIAAIEKKISAQMSAREKEHNKYNKQEKELTKLLEKRRAVYKETEAARKQQEAELAKLAKEAKNLDDLVLKIKKRSKTEPAAAAALPPDMIPPVSGTVKTAFGEKDDMGAKSRGVTFNTRPGATVVVPLSGTVRFAGPFQKYRQILIVEHKGGYHSLIAGLGRIDTVVGASLTAGEPVGIAAKTDNDAQPVYYELRRNGDPVDPRKMLAARKQGKDKS